MRPSLLAIIPARGGSKGLPRKNLAPVLGEPLVARAVRCALETNAFDVVFTSTDDEEIARAACNAGGDVSFLRSDEASSDEATSLSVVAEVLSEWRERGRSFDGIALLEPTSPLRTKEIVLETVRRAFGDDFDACLTVTSVPLHYHLEKQIRLDPDGAAVSALKGTPLGTPPRRQQLAPTYIRNGMCYAVRTASLDAGSDLLGFRPTAFVVPGLAVSIDDSADLERARIALGDRSHPPPPSQIEDQIR